MSATISSNRPSSAKGIAVHKIWRAALAAVIAAVAVNLILRAGLAALVGFPAEFPPLQPPPIIIFTTLGVVAAGIVYAVVARVAKNPLVTYRVIALAALIVSILPNFGLMANPASAPFPGGSALTFGLLIIFHIAAALVAVLVLEKLTRE